MTHHEIAIEKFGTAHSLTFRERAPAPPAPGEVAIDVKYSGVNFADVQMRLGFYPDAPKKPFVPGYEVSGVVAEVGPGVTAVKRGDAVVAGTYFGGYASRVTIPATQVFPLPRNATLETGAALPVNYFTAQLALHDMARVRAGDKVLIECATGGVGTRWRVTRGDAAAGEVGTDRRQEPLFTAVVSAGTMRPSARRGGALPRSDPGKAGDACGHLAN